MKNYLISHNYETSTWKSIYNEETRGPPFFPFSLCFFDKKGKIRIPLSIMVIIHVPFLTLEHRKNHCSTETGPPSLWLLWDIIYTFFSKIIFPKTKQFLQKLKKK